MQSQFLTRLTTSLTGPRQYSGSYVDWKYPGRIIVRPFANHIQVFEIGSNGQLKRSTFFWGKQDDKPRPNERRAAVRLFVQVLRLIDLKRQDYNVKADPAGIFDYPVPELSHL